MKQALIPGASIQLWVRVFGPGGMHDVHALLDTGAAFVTVPTRVATALGYDLRSAPLQQVTTASGVIWAPKITLSRVSFAELAAVDVPALCLDLPGSPMAALIRMNLISRFNVTLDATHRELRITTP
jgi:clan AA aspartic protease (TIGR02281 family)